MHASKPCRELQCRPQQQSPKYKPTWLKKFRPKCRPRFNNSYKAFNKPLFGDGGEDIVSAGTSQLGHRGVILR